MMRSLGYWAAAGFLLAACVSLAAEVPSSPTAWVEIVASGSASEVFRPVVEEAVRYRLEPLGLNVRLHGSQAGVSPSGITPASKATLLEGAKRAGAEFALEVRYAGSGSSLAIAFTWYEVPLNLLLAAVDRKGSVDLELDTLILDTLDEVVVRVKGRVEERVAASGIKPGSGTPGPAADAANLRSPAGSTETAGHALPKPETAAPATGPASESPALEALPGTGPLPSAQMPAPASRYEGARLLIAPTVAPFIAVGAASYYFPIGYESVLQVGLLPRATGGRLGLGVLLGVTGFQAQGATETGRGFLVPAGLLLRYGLEWGRHWGLLFHLGAGPAVLILSTESQGSLTKLLPYVRSGVGAELALGRRASLGLEAAYEVYFETPYLIMGFAPGLCFCLRL